MEDDQIKKIDERIFIFVDTYEISKLVQNRTIHRENKIKKPGVEKISHGEKKWHVGSDKNALDRFGDNGFLLLPLIDRLFDRGLITFSDDKKLILPNLVSDINWKRLNLINYQKIDKLSINDKDVLVEVRENPPVGEGSMGVAISNTEMVKLPWYQFYEGIKAGFEEAYYWGEIIFGGVIKMIGGLLSGNVPKDVAGPIGMYQATSSINKNQGLLAVIHFFAICYSNFYKVIYL